MILFGTCAQRPRACSASPVTHCRVAPIKLHLGMRPASARTLQRICHPGRAWAGDSSRRTGEFADHKTERPHHQAGANEDQSSDHEETSEWCFQNDGSEHHGRHTAARNCQSDPEQKRGSALFQSGMTGPLAHALCPVVGLESVGFEWMSRARLVADAKCIVVLTFIRPARTSERTTLRE